MDFTKLPTLLRHKLLEANIDEETFKTIASISMDAISAEDFNNSVKEKIHQTLNDIGHQKLLPVLYQETLPTDDNDIIALYNNYGIYIDTTDGYNEMISKLVSGGLMRVISNKYTQTQYTLLKEVLDERRVPNIHTGNPRNGQYDLHTHSRVQSRSHMKPPLSTQYIHIDHVCR